MQHGARAPLFILFVFSFSSLYYSVSLTVIWSFAFFILFFRCCIRGLVSFLTKLKCFFSLLVAIILNPVCHFTISFISIQQKKNVQYSHKRETVLCLVSILAFFWSKILIILAIVLRTNNSFFHSLSQLKVVFYF